MLRSFVIAVTLLLLAASGVVLYERIRQDGVGRVVHALSFRQSGAQAAADELLSAATTLEKSHDLDETYTRADLSRYEDLVLAYASDSNYCIQVRKGREWYHLVGPGGIPASGACVS